MSWTLAQAEELLLDRELLSIDLGLDRVERLLGRLGSPQRDFRSIHVVGTNGKSSTSRFLAAILHEHGVRTGTYLSPHLVSFTERVRIGAADCDPGRFAAAVERVAAAADDLPEGARVTQFEALTAAAFVLFAEHAVDVAVVEAGLGGRLDATNVLPSSVQVLTNVGLEHTALLGDTIAAIAREKLAVVRPGSTLVAGPLAGEALELARAVAAGAGTRLVTVAERPGGYQQTNFALAQAAAQAYLGPLDEKALARAAMTHVPGRLELIGGEPPVLADVAHNPDGMRALLSSLPPAVRDRRLIAVVSILADKDAAAMLGLLRERCAAIVVTASANPRAVEPATLAALAGATAIVEPDPQRAVERASALAGADGAVLIVGSNYLLGDLRRGEKAARASMI